MAASYPGAVKAFASRANGQTIDASHINDLQDEVTALESGLLNGTAPLTSSRASVASLQVTGNSTITGQLTVTGNVLSSATLSGLDLNISGGSTLAGNLTAQASLFFSGGRSTVLSTGDTHNISAANVAHLYVQTNSSGSTLTGFAASGPGQVMIVFNGGPSAVLGLKNSSGSLSTNQLQLPSDTNLAVGAAATFYKSGIADRWIRIG